MIEDKLTQDQRIRLEAFAQINAVSHGASIEGKLDMAAKVEEYIKNGKEGTK